MNSDVIYICFVIDNIYVTHCSVAIKSILQQFDKTTNRKIVFLILHNGLTANKQSALKLASKSSYSDIEFTKIDDEKFQGLPVSSYSHYKLINYFRISIPSLFPSLNKVLYLDADIVVNSDINKLWDIDIDGKYLACCHDAVDQTNRIKELVKVPSTYKYYNSGVLLINCRKWREDNIEEKLFNTAKTHYNSIYLPDQDTLNITLNDNILYLDADYNYQINLEKINSKKLTSDKVTIIHYVGPIKPWDVSPTNYWAKFYYNYYPTYKLLFHTLSFFVKDSIKKFIICMRFLYAVFIINWVYSRSKIIICGCNELSKKILLSKFIKKDNIQGIIEVKKNQDDVEFMGYELEYPCSMCKFNFDVIINTDNMAAIKDHMGFLINKLNKNTKFINV